MPKKRQKPEFRPREAGVDLDAAAAASIVDRVLADIDVLVENELAADGLVDFVTKLAPSKPPVFESPGAVYDAKLVELGNLARAQRLIDETPERKTLRSRVLTSIARDEPESDGGEPEPFDEATGPMAEISAPPPLGFPVSVQLHKPGGGATPERHRFETGDDALGFLRGVISRTETRSVVSLVIDR